MTSRAPVPPVEVSRAGPDDWATWSDVRLRGLQESPDAFGGAWEAERGRTEGDWRAELAASYLVVARLGGDVVGTGGLMGRDPAMVRVVAMWTTPDARGRGVGSAVLRHLLAASGQAHPGAEVRLWVAHGNPARTLYERAGFVPTGATEPIRPGASLLKDEMVLRGSARPGPS